MNLENLVVTPFSRNLECPIFTLHCKVIGNQIHFLNKENKKQRLMKGVNARRSQCVGKAICSATAVAHIVIPSVLQLHRCKCNPDSWENIHVIKSTHSPSHCSNKIVILNKELCLVINGYLQMESGQPTLKCYVILKQHYVIF